MKKVVDIKESYDQDNGSITRIERYEDGTVWLVGLSTYSDMIDIHAHNFDVSNAPSNVSITIKTDDNMYIPFLNLVEKYNGYKEMLDPYYKYNKKRIIFSKDENDNVVITFYNDKLNYDVDNEYGDYGYKFSIIYYKYQDALDKQDLFDLYNELKESLQKSKVKKIEQN